MEEINNQNQETNNDLNKDKYNEWDRSHRRGKMFGGVLIVIVGCFFLAREMGYVLPHWLFSWKTLLITIGLFVGVKHSFRGYGWMVPILIGTTFLLRDYYHAYQFSHYLLPLTIIVIGIYVLLRPHKSHQQRMIKFQRHMKWKRDFEFKSSGDMDDYIDASAVFGSIKKNIISKNFKGGEVNSVFGGAEVNLSQADISGTVEMEVNAVFGGTKLIIPPHWEINSKLDSVFGSVEDKRAIYKDMNSQGKVLVLKGAAVFGGIEIKSF